VDHVPDDVPRHARAPHGPAGLPALADHRIPVVFELFHQIHGGHVIIPGERHALAALEDSVVLLTVVKPMP
jgi:hypothetical protein